MKVFPWCRSTARSRANNRLGGIDDYHAGFEIASHVVATGRRRIALVGGPEASSASMGRMHGYQEALRKAGLTALNEPDVWGN